VLPENRERAIFAVFSHFEEAQFLCSVAEDQKLSGRKRFGFGFGRK
jgi:hypothetical protein